MASKSTSKATERELARILAEFDANVAMQRRRMIAALEETCATLQRSCEEELSKLPAALDGTTMRKFSMDNGWDMTAALRGLNVRPQRELEADEQLERTVKKRKTARTETASPIKQRMPASHRKPIGSAVKPSHRARTASNANFVYVARPSLAPVNPLLPKTPAARSRGTIGNKTGRNVRRGESIIAYSANGSPLNLDFTEQDAEALAAEEDWEMVSRQGSAAPEPAGKAKKPPAKSKAQPTRRTTRSRSSSLQATQPAPAPSTHVQKPAPSQDTFQAPDLKALEAMINSSITNEKVRQDFIKKLHQMQSL